MLRKHCWPGSNRQSQTFALPSHCHRPSHDGTVFCLTRNAGAASDAWHADGCCLWGRGCKLHAATPPFWKAMGKYCIWGWWGMNLDLVANPAAPRAAVYCIQRPGAFQQHCATVPAPALSSRCTCLVEASGSSPIAFLPERCLSPDDCLAHESNCALSGRPCPSHRVGFLMYF